MWNLQVVASPSPWLASQRQQQQQQQQQQQHSLLLLHQHIARSSIYIFRCRQRLRRRPSIAHAFPDRDSERSSTAKMQLPRRPLLASGLLLLHDSVLTAEAEEAGGGDRDGGEEERDLEGVITEKVFMDVAIEGREVGRMVIGLYGWNVGARRFAEIAEGKKGVSYRNKEFIKIMPGSYVQNAGLRSFSLSGERRDSADFAGSPAEMAAELAAQKKKGGGAVRNVAGSVSIFVEREGGGDGRKKASKLVARGGKLAFVEEEAVAPRNATEFAICLNDCGELDATNLVVGRVVDGFSVLDSIAKVKVVQQNTASPYFQVAKLVGDTRAIVAERGFNRPYSKIVITKCGRLPDPIPTQP